MIIPRLLNANSTITQLVRAFGNLDCVQKQEQAFFLDMDLIKLHFEDER